MEQKEISNEARFKEIEKIIDIVDSIPGDMKRQFPCLGDIVEELIEICKQQESRITELERQIQYSIEVSESVDKEFSTLKMNLRRSI